MALNYVTFHIFYVTQWVALANPRTEMGHHFSTFQHIVIINWLFGMSYNEQYGM